MPSYETSTTVAVLEVDPQVDLVAAGRVDVADLAVVRLAQAASLRVLVVVQDDLLVELVELHQRTPSAPWPARHQGVDLLGRVVQVERRPGHRRHAEPDAGRPGAVVPHPDLHALGVEHLADVVRVDAGDGRTRSCRRGPTGVGGPKIRRSGTSPGASSAYGGELLLVPGDGVHADAGEVVDRRAEPDRLGDRRRAGLEPGRRRRERRPLHRDGLDHRAAAEERRHRGEQLARPHSTPMPVGPSILCPVKATKSASSSATSTGMCGTDCERPASPARPTSRARSRDPGGGVDRAEDVGDQHHRDELGPLVDQLVQCRTRPAGRRR